jgi:streptogramin lyase
VSIYSAVNGLAQVVRMPFRFSSQSDQIVVASSAHGLAGADGVAIDGAGNLYVSDPVNNQVLRIPPGCPASSCTTVVASTSNGGIQGPQGLAVDGAGDLFITDQGNNRVLEVPAGCATSACQVALGAGLNQPFSVAVDLAGNIYISDTNNNRVVKIPFGCSSAACQTTVASSLNQPHGIAVDAAGDLYIAETGGVLEISTTQSGFLLSGSQLSSNTPLDVALDQAGSLYIADPTATTVSELDRGDTPFIVFTGSVPVSQVSAPQNVTVENIGTAPLNVSDVAPNFNTAVDVLRSTCAASAVVMPGASCTVAVEFSPAEPGSDGGTVVLHDNARNQLDAQQLIRPSISRGCPVLSLWARLRLLSRQPPARDCR